MATSKKFSELPAASTVGNGDLFAIAHEDALAETGYVSQKLTAAQAGQKVNGDTEYPTSLPSFPENGQNPFAALEKLNQDIIDLYPVSTASGSIATFSTSLELPLVECKAEIVAQQAGTGAPSPSNPRSISGFSSVNLYQRGVNLWDEEWESGSFNTSGEPTPNADWSRTVSFIPVKSSTYVYAYIEGASSSNNAWIFSYDKNKTFIGREIIESSRVFGIPANACFIKFQYKRAIADITNYKVSINYPSTKTTYIPYNSQSETKTIALGQTVYGGVLDVIRGKLRVTHGIKTFDGTLSYTMTGDGKIVYCDATPEAKVIGSNYGQTTAICEHFRNEPNSAAIRQGAVDMSFNIGSAYFSNKPRTVFRNSNWTSVTDAINFFTVNPTQIIYELATPIEITGLTPANFTTIAGEQNIFADCGDISVSFKQGIQEYIDAKIAETQALILNS